MSKGHATVKRMPTVSDFAQVFQTTPNTVRNWAGEFADYLSPAANPQPGETRFFDDNDARVMALVGSLRRQQASYEQIHEALQRGDRADWPLELPQDEQAAQTGLTIREQQLAATVAKFEGELGAVREERDHLREQLEETQERLIDAERRAAHLAGKLEALEGIEEEKPLPRSWWQRLTGQE